MEDFKKIPRSLMIDDNNQLTTFGGLVIVLTTLMCLDKGILDSDKVLDILIDKDK